MRLYTLSTYYKEIWDEIYSQVGDPYTFWESLRLGGIGSPRLILVDSTDQDINELIFKTNASKDCNIQLLKQGILIRFRSRNDEYGISIKFNEIAKINIKSLKETDQYQGAKIASVVLTSNERVDLVIRKFEINRFNRFVDKFLTKKGFDII
ncbi:hypothetical protein [Marinigracilibium pacificum]|uniref:Uncharacterized protein n=1 Tax=Marinigracilibium pacificum TaxID=2729599 RepID=A0A848J6J9_9BACT|nr:hypothetical protein [Marinigracilibium pacificum]NMM50009.1 hypothetical protein [Marinigracilibium pacificum]